MLKMKAMNLVTKLLKDRACDITKPIMTLNVNGIDIEGRVDGGADIAAIPSDLADKLKLKIETWKESPLQAINKTEVFALGLAPVTITHKGIKKLLPVVILPSSYSQDTSINTSLNHLERCLRFFFTFNLESIMASAPKSPECLMHLPNA